MSETPSVVFDRHRPHMRAVAYRMLGSLGDADDAVQDTWLRFSNVDQTEIANVGGWLTTVVSRICIDKVRHRMVHREEPLDVFVPDPILTEDNDPEAAAVLADSIGFALLVVLDTLPPLERVAFVLHDGFGVPFDEIASIVDRNVEATRQLASRARRRVRESPAAGADSVDATLQRELVEAWASAAQRGDFDGLVQLLDPDAVLRVDTGVAATSRRVIGAAKIARGASTFGRAGGTEVRLVSVNGRPGLVVEREGRLGAVAHFTMVGDRVVAIDILADPVRVARLRGQARGGQT
jgi:RNA polymerase sigma-70 factor (ECF subfamily)